MTQAGHKKRKTKNSDRLMVQSHYISFPFMNAKSHTTVMILPASKMYPWIPFSEKQVSNDLMLQNNASSVMMEAWIVSDSVGLLKCPNALLDYCNILRIFFLIKVEILALHLKKNVSQRIWKQCYRKAIPDVLWEVMKAHLKNTDIQ